MNVRGVKPRPDPNQLELNFNRPMSLKDYADMLTKAIIFGSSVMDFRGRVYSPEDMMVMPYGGRPRGPIQGTRADTIILDDIEWTSQRHNS